MADRVWSEKVLIRRADRRLAVLQHAEEVSSASVNPNAMRRTVLQCWFGLGFRGYSSPDIDGDIPTALRRFIILHQLILASYSQPEAAGFILRGIKGIFVAIGSVIAAVICAIVAAMKGRNPFGWGILGLFFSILTLIVVIVIPSKK